MSGSEIDNAQAAMGEGDRAAQVEIGVIGAAVGDRRTHVLEDASRRRERLGGGETSDAAHFANGSRGPFLGGRQP